MDIFKVVAVGIIATVFALILKKDAPQFAMMISIGACVLIFLMVLPRLTAVFELLNGISSYMTVNNGFVKAVLKIIGIAYITEFGSQLCADAGENAVASKIELGGKILIMGISAPIVLSLLDLVVGLTNYK